MRQIELNPNENSRAIHINSADELTYYADNEFIDHNIQSRFVIFLLFPLIILLTPKDPSQNLFSLAISIPGNRAIKGVIESNLKIYNFLTNQTEVVKVIYDPLSTGSRSYYSAPASSKDSSTGFSFLDAIITLICLLVLLLVLNNCRGQWF